MRRWMICISIVLLWGCFLPQCVCAQVETVEEAFGAQGSVYVAGNPDGYPLEYYDTGTKQYEGIMPDILKDISDRTGIDFVYISGGEKDCRAQLAANCQVELVSGCFTEEKDFWHSVTFAGTIYTVTWKGKEYHASFGFTKAATKKLRQAVEDELLQLQPAKSGDMAVSAMYRDRCKTPSCLLRLLPVIVGILLVCGISVGWYVWARRQKKKNEAGMLVDKVTGKGNGEYFCKRFSAELTGQIKPLYFIIYTGFDIKRVNACYGEKEAEDILRYEAEVLSRRMQESDFFGRVAGGDFAAACQCISRERAQKLAEGIVDEMNEYCRKHFVNYVPAFSAGIYQLNKDGISGREAIYRARLGYEYADAHALSYAVSDDVLLRQTQEERELQRQCVQAIQNREFVCCIQFMQDVKSGVLCAAEVLSRWQHPQKGLLLPGKYIRDMEENGTVTELDFYMLEQTCRLLLQLQDEGFPDMYLFCNVSRRTFSSEHFLERLQRVLAQYAVDVSHLCLEITESSDFDNRQKALENICACKEMGFALAFDDLGKGRLVFADLCSCPADIVKFDRTLMPEAQKPPGRQLLAEMNTLAHNLGLRTFCQGIETKQQYDMAVQIGIDCVQGYYVQRVLPVKEAVAYLKKDM